MLLQCLVDVFSMATDLICIITVSCVFHSRMFYFVSLSSYLYFIICVFFPVLCVKHFDLHTVHKRYYANKVHCFIFVINSFTSFNERQANSLYVYASLYSDCVGGGMCVGVSRELNY